MSFSGGKHSSLFRKLLVVIKQTAYEEYSQVRCKRSVAIVAVVAVVAVASPC